MPKPVRISLDAMGGDHGPAVVVPGAALALERHPGLRFLMFGDEAVIRPLLDAKPALKDAVELRHTDVAVRDGRQAEPGAAGRAAQLLDVARDPGGAATARPMPRSRPATPAR